jgi:hypothetical protein
MCQLEPQLALPSKPGPPPEGCPLRKGAVRVGLAGAPDAVTQTIDVLRTRSPFRGGAQAALAKLEEIFELRPVVKPECVELQEGDEIVVRPRGGSEFVLEAAGGSQAIVGQVVPSGDLQCKEPWKGPELIFVRVLPRIERFRIDPEEMRTLVLERNIERLVRYLGLLPAGHEVLLIDPVARCLALLGWVELGLWRLQHRWVRAVRPRAPGPALEPGAWVKVADPRDAEPELLPTLWSLVGVEGRLIEAGSIERADMEGQQTCYIVRLGGELRRVRSVVRCERIDVEMDEGMVTDRDPNRVLAYVRATDGDLDGIGSRHYPVVAEKMAEPLSHAGLVRLVDWRLPGAWHVAGAVGAGDGVEVEKSEGTLAAAVGKRGVLERVELGCDGVVRCLVRVAGEPRARWATKIAPLDDVEV